MALGLITGPVFIPTTLKRLKTAALSSGCVNTELLVPGIRLEEEEKKKERKAAKHFDLRIPSSPSLQQIGVCLLQHAGKTEQSGSSPIGPVLMFGIVMFPQSCKTTSLKYLRNSAARFVGLVVSAQPSQAA